MGLVATLAAIDVERGQVASARADVEAARVIIQASRTSGRALEGDLDDDIREVEANGLGVKITAGFLAAVPGGETKDFEWTGGAGNRKRISFTYDKDSDTLSNIQYDLASKDRETGEL